MTSPAHFRCPLGVTILIIINLALSYFIVITCILRRHRAFFVTILIKTLFTRLWGIRWQVEEYRSSRPQRSWISRVYSFMTRRILQIVRICYSQMNMTIMCLFTCQGAWQWHYSFYISSSFQFTENICALSPLKECCNL